MSIYLIYNEFQNEKNLALKDQVFDVYDNKVPFKLIAKKQSVVNNNNAISFSIESNTNRQVRLSLLACELLKPVKVIFINNDTNKLIMIKSRNFFTLENIYATSWDVNIDGYHLRIEIKHKDHDVLVGEEISRSLSDFELRIYTYKPTGEELSDTFKSVRMLRIPSHLKYREKIYPFYENISYSYAMIEWRITINDSIILDFSNSNFVFRYGNVTNETFGDPFRSEGVILDDKTSSIIYNIDPSTWDGPTLQFVSNDNNYRFLLIDMSITYTLDTLGENGLMWACGNKSVKQEVVLDEKRLADEGFSIDALGYMSVPCTNAIDTLCKSNTWKSQGICQCFQDNNVYKEYFDTLSNAVGQQVLGLITSGTPIQCYYPKCVTCGLFPYNYGTTCKNISQQNICIQDVKNSSITSDKVDLQCNFGAKPNATPSTNNNNTTMIIIGVCAALLILLLGIFIWWKKQKAMKKEIK